MRAERLKLRTIVIVTAIQSFSIWSSAARADSVLLSNLAESPVAAVGFNNTVLAAISFSTAQVSATLDDVQAQLASNPGTTVFAQIRVDSNNSPGDLVTLLTTVTFTQATSELATFDATSPLTLDAGAKYWLVLGTTDSSGANWSVASDTNYVSSIGWTINSRTQSNDGGNTWLNPFTDTFVLFGLNGTVPEPSSLVLLLSGLGLAGATAWMRLRYAANL
jgi:hypothetical protein